jgi:ketosteroid isomerase-like protein
VEELIHQVMRAVNERDFDALDELPFHPEFEFHSLLSVSEGTTLAGVDGLRQWAADVDAIWDDFHVVIEEVRMADEDTAVLCLHLTGRARASGVPLDQRTGQVWTRRDGLLHRNVGYPTPREALEACGLG